MSAALDMRRLEHLATDTAHGLLRVITCGSVDDGKSTLLGRMLFDAGVVPSDQVAALDRDSRRFGTLGEARDFALLVDGLAAEREQGITIDVAHRYFATARRAFIVADAPGHEQYTRNMATGASTADVAVILLDARQGILPQTRRHSCIVAMVGVRHVVLAVNKMDLVGFEEATFRAIEAAYRAAVAPLGFASITAVPLCARAGDNVVHASARMPWFRGQPLLPLLETLPDRARGSVEDAFRLPVQWVNRPNLDFRGYAGTIASGRVQVGDRVVVLPAGYEAGVARVITPAGEARSASAGEPVTLALDAHVDVARGDVLAHVDDTASASARLAVRLLWMEEAPLVPGQTFLLRIGTATTGATVAAIDCMIEIDSFATRPARSLTMNQLGLVELHLDRPLVALPYRAGPDLGALILIDRVRNATVAMAVVEQADASPASIPLSTNAAVRPVVSPQVVRVAGHLASHALLAAALAAVVVMGSGDTALAVMVALSAWLGAALIGVPALKPRATASPSDIVPGR